jgi:hypothetical protein
VWGGAGGGNALGLDARLEWAVELWEVRNGDSGCRQCFHFFFFWVILEFYLHNPCRACSRLPAIILKRIANARGTRYSDGAKKLPAPIEVAKST